MESLEELKAIIAGKPEGATDFSNRFNRLMFYKHSFLLGWFYWDGGCYRPLNTCPSNKTRSLSDIERIIELEEKLNNSETKKEDCKHPSSTASYTHVTCDSCYMIRTDGGWGCASRKWFDNIESAKFYEKNGFLPR